MLISSPFNKVGNTHFVASSSSHKLGSVRKEFFGESSPTTRRQVSSTVTKKKIQHNSLFLQMFILTSSTNVFLVTIVLQIRDDKMLLFCIRVFQVRTVLSSKEKCLLLGCNNSLIMDYVVYSRPTLIRHFAVMVLTRSRIFLMFLPSQMAYGCFEVS